MIPQSQSPHRNTPVSLPTPNVNEVVPALVPGGQDQGTDEVQADQEQVLQEFEFENDSTGQMENLSSQ